MRWQQGYLAVVGFRQKSEEAWSWNLKRRRKPTDAEPTKQVECVCLFLYISDSLFQCIMPIHKIYIWKVLCRSDWPRKQYLNVSWCILCMRIYFISRFTLISLDIHMIRIVCQSSSGSIPVARQGRKSNRFLQRRCCDILKQRTVNSRRIFLNMVIIILYIIYE